MTAVMNSVVSFPCSIRREELLEYLRNYQLLKDFAPWSPETFYSSDYVNIKKFYILSTRIIYVCTWALNKQLLFLCAELTDWIFVTKKECEYRGIRTETNSNSGKFLFSSVYVTMWTTLMSEHVRIFSNYLTTGYGSHGVTSVGSDDGWIQKLNIVSILRNKRKLFKSLHCRFKKLLCVILREILLKNLSINVPICKNIFSRHVSK